jgi:predicted transcriptional regulator
VFAFFNDGEWHSLDEVGNEFQIERSTVEQMVIFLERSGFLTLNEQRDKAIMYPLVLQILGDV